MSTMGKTVRKKKVWNKKVKMWEIIDGERETDKVTTEEIEREWEKDKI